MNIDFLINKTIDGIKKHFDEDGWDLSVDSVIIALTEELEDSADLKTEIADRIKKATGAMIVENDKGDKVFRK